MRVLAIFGPTAVGKTGVAIEAAELLRLRGEDPVAVSADAIQVYEGLEILSGAPGPAERERLEHRMVGFVPIDGEFSVGRYAGLAHDEIDQLIAAGRRPIVVGGTGLYLRAALDQLELRPPVSAELRAEVEGELADRGAAALHAELDSDLASTVHPNDGKRIARLTELSRAGIEPARGSEGLWGERLRRPTLLVGLVCDRNELRQRIESRVGEMLRLGAVDEVSSAALAGASRTARYAIGFDELLGDDVEAMKVAQWRFARRQLTWMRKMDDVRVIDRSGRSDAEVAVEVVEALDRE